MVAYIEVVGGILLAVVVYFLKKTMEELKETQKS